MIRITYFSMIGYDENGKPITKNVTANEKSKCLEKLEKLKEEINFICNYGQPILGS